MCKPNRNVKQIYTFRTSVVFWRMQVMLDDIYIYYRTIPWGKLLITNVKSGGMKDLKRLQMQDAGVVALLPNSITTAFKESESERT